MSQLCFNCNKLLTEGKTVTVGRGMKTLIDASIERGDTTNKNILFKKFICLSKIPKPYFIFTCDNRLRYYISNVQKK